jgi:hypothetical protein
VQGTVASKRTPPARAEENLKKARWRRGARPTQVALLSPREKRNHTAKKSNPPPTQDPGPGAPREQITLVLYTSEVTHTQTSCC